jgi:hypothetical protein
MMVMLTIKNGMDPHMISWDTGWYVNGLVRSITVKLSHVTKVTLCSWSWESLSHCPIGAGGSPNK